MRTVMLALLAMATIIPSLGCAAGGARNACASCKQCGHGGHGRGAHGGGCVRDGFFARNFGPQNHVSPTAEGAGAPSSAQVAYPYYTTRGPRDFLLNNPPPLGY